ncbi:MAG TPA: bifunctional diaminohydroxyphosphoribosylaminopyrimidine deaminase/5-amino-6-(5-phosphoribosylamino)uracil reductase RibD [Acidimicrobiia bacterium]|nr:bifunctional diaminohydroxyphosphoribosylaminopyrimidine deaminase/5-amino-6-(5-phosphoribosylamino)uracil reductase RibD [Acidimicrobiia bacterium]
MRDDEAMRAAIELARGARRHTAPWPAVGCVIVRGGAVVGSGATGPFPTGPHAEVAALQNAGDRARGATAYSTLEPCNHHTNTPPCTEALIAAGVTRVVVAVDDPDPRVAGRGYERLRSAGIELICGIAREEATRDLRPYLHQRATGHAFAVAKIATSLDGRIAAADGSSQWITGPAARADAHELRADSQAIVVGSGTALADDPSLTVRDADPKPLRAPLRVLLDARGRVPATGQLFDDAAPTLVCTTNAAPGARIDEWRAAGAKVEMLAAGGISGVDLDAVLTVLAGENVLQALFEGGAGVLGSLVDRGLAQRLVVYVGPTVLGPAAAPSFLTTTVGSIANAPRWHLASVRTIDPDVRLEYEAAR